MVHLPLMTGGCHRHSPHEKIFDFRNGEIFKKENVFSLYSLKLQNWWKYQEKLFSLKSSKIIFSSYTLKFIFYCVLSLLDNDSSLYTLTVIDIELYHGDWSWTSSHIFQEWTLQRFRRMFLFHGEDLLITSIGFNSTASKNDPVVKRLFTIWYCRVWWCVYSVNFNCSWYIECHYRPEGFKAEVGWFILLFCSIQTRHPTNYYLEKSSWSWRKTLTMYVLTNSSKYTTTERIASY